MTGRATQPVTSLYLHVPFCAHKCEYCAFYSESAGGDTINRYVAALVRDPILDVAYVGNKGTKLPAFRNLNQRLLSFNPANGVPIAGARPLVGIGSALKQPSQRLHLAAPRPRLGRRQQAESQAALLRPRGVTCR